MIVMNDSVVLLQGEFVLQSKHLRLAIISFIPMIVMNDSVVLLQGEFGCWSLLGFKGLRKFNIHT